MKPPRSFRFLFPTVLAAILLSSPLAHAGFPGPYPPAPPPVPAPPDDNVSDAALGKKPFTPGFATITVANMNQITVIGDSGKPVWQYTDPGGMVPDTIVPLLLLE